MIDLGVIRGKRKQCEICDGSREEFAPVFRGTPPPALGLIIKHKLEILKGHACFSGVPLAYGLESLMVTSVIDVNLVFCKPWYEAMTRYLLCVCLSQIRRLLLHHMLTTVDSYGVSAIVNT